MPVTTADCDHPVRLGLRFPESLSACFIQNSLEFAVQCYRSMLPAHPPAIAVRISIVMLVLTFIDDGLREFKDVPAQCGYLENASNNIHMPHWAAMLYVLWSLAVQLGAGGYMLVYAVASPGARLLLPHPSSGPWRHIRVALWLLAAFVSSSVVVYGFGQPASQHAQGRLVFILRNLGILGGVLLLLGAGAGSRPAHGFLLLLARGMLAGHGLELAPVNSIALLSIVDIVVLPFALALLLGLQTHALAPSNPAQPILALSLVLVLESHTRPQLARPRPHQARRRAGTRRTAHHLRPEHQPLLVGLSLQR